MIALGRNFLLFIENPAVPGVFRVVAKCRNNGLSYNNAAVDVSKNDGTRWKKVLRGGGQALSISADGVFSDDITMVWITDLVIHNKPGTFKLIDGIGNSIVGQFVLPSFGKSGPHNKEQSFSFSLNSKGRPLFFPKKA